MCLVYIEKANLNEEGQAKSLSTGGVVTRSELVVYALPIAASNVVVLCSSLLCNPVAGVPRIYQSCTGMLK